MFRGLGHKNAAKIISANSKGQLISKVHFGFFKSTIKHKKTKFNIMLIVPLFFFDLTSILEAKAEILIKISLLFFGRFEDTQNVLSKLTDH